MHRPVLVTPPAQLPVSLLEAKAHLRVDHSEDDALISSLVTAATAHLDGWTGILGRCLVDQTWRQDFDSFARYLELPLGPVSEIVDVKWRNAAGQIATVSASESSLVTDAGGQSYVRFRDAFSYPSGLHERGAVSVTYRAGHAATPAAEGPPAVAETTEVPAPIKIAILLTAAHWYGQREAASADQLAEIPLGVTKLLSPFLRVRI